jgi:hypothetical protein
MALAVLLVRNLNIFSILLVAMLVYLVAAAILGTIPREDLLAIYSAIRHKAQQASPNLSIEGMTEQSRADTIPILSIEGHEVHQVSSNPSVVEQETELELPTASETPKRSTERRKAHRTSPRKILLCPVEQETEPELPTGGKVSSTEENIVASEVVQ